jgi:hypothetical protein
MGRTPRKKFNTYPRKKTKKALLSPAYTSFFLEKKKKKPIRNIKTGAAGGPPKNSRIRPSQLF